MADIIPPPRRPLTVGHANAQIQHFFQGLVDACEVAAPYNILPHYPATLKWLVSSFNAAGDMGGVTLVIAPDATTEQGRATVTDENGYFLVVNWGPIDYEGFHFPIHLQSFPPVN